MKKILTLVLACLLSSTSLAQDANPTSLSFSEITSGGDITGCSLIFRVVGNDFTYRKGKSIITWGNFSYHGKAFSFKLASTDTLKGLEYIKSGKIDLLKSDTIHYAYFRPTICQFVSQKECKSSSGQEVKFYKSDSPDGAFFGIYKLDNKIAQEVNAGFDNIEIGFNRKKNGYDIKLILDLQSQENQEEKKKYSECISNILNR